MVTFLYTVDETSDEPIMLIDRHVGYDAEDGYGIMGDMFQRELLALDGMNKKRIQIWINSPGGVVADGYSIYNAMLKTKTKVDTYNIGIAASISAVIFQGGRTRYMADYSKLMYHNPYGGDDAKGLDAVRDSLITMISSRTGKTDDEVKKIMNKTTWIGADEAKETGFCDVVEDSAEKNKKRVIESPEEAKAFWSYSNKILNSILNIEKKADMKKIANKLNLNPEATEDSMVAEIDTISNKLKKAESDVVNKETDLKKKQEELDALNKKVTDLTNEMDSMKAKAKTDEEAKAKAEKEAKTKAEAEEEGKAKNMIEGFAAAGRIKNEAEVIAEWIADCKVLGIDKVKARIEKLPLNVKSSGLIVNKFESKKTGSVIANKMAQLQAAGK